MRVTLWKQSHETCQGGDGGERLRVVQHARGMSLHQLDIEAAEMLREPRAPGDADEIAGLKQGAHAARAPSPHKPEMASMAKGQNLSDHVRLAERLGGEEDAFVAPVHVQA